MRPIQSFSFNDILREFFDDDPENLLIFTSAIPVFKNYPVKREEVPPPKKEAFPRVLLFNPQDHQELKQKIIERRQRICPFPSCSIGSDSE